MTAPTPQISIHLTNFAKDGSAGWQGLLALAQAADRAGVDRLVVSDHVVFGEQLDAYADPTLGGTAGGRQPTGPDGHWLEPMTLLAVIAGMTSTIRLGTSILLAALRRPVVLAKQAATLDVLSAGRLDLGVGIGWQREEYEAAGLEFSRRGALLDHTLAVCQTLWRDDVSKFADAELSFDRIHSMPKPAQPGGVPIWVSGRINSKTVARVVRFGTGWIPWGDDVIDPSRGVDVLRTALVAVGRDPRSLGVQGSLPVVATEDGTIDVDATLTPVPRLADVGISDFRLGHRWSPADERLDDQLSSIVSEFRRITAGGF